MRTYLKLGLIASATVIAAAPAIAGEITGNGKPTALQGQSWCRYSGLNDTPYLDGFGQTQSYGQLVRLYPDLFDPRYFNPNTSYPESCNPTNQGVPPPGADGVPPG